jgi:hypothetical protein
MDGPDHPVFSDIERDAEAGVGEAFARLVAGYLADTRTGDGPVSTRSRSGSLSPLVRSPMAHFAPA